MITEVKCLFLCPRLSTFFVEFFTVSFGNLGSETLRTYVSSDLDGLRTSPRSIISETEVLGNTVPDWSCSLFVLQGPRFGLH